MLCEHRCNSFCSYRIGLWCNRFCEKRVFYYITLIQLQRIKEFVYVCGCGCTRVTNYILRKLIDCEFYHVYRITSECQRVHHIISRACILVKTRMCSIWYQKKCNEVIWKCTNIKGAFQSTRVVDMRTPVCELFLKIQCEFITKFEWSTHSTLHYVTLTLIFPRVRVQFFVEFILKTIKQWLLNKSINHNHHATHSLCLYTHCPFCCPPILCVFV